MAVRIGRGSELLQLCRNKPTNNGEAMAEDYVKCKAS
jgi:hypothetical protein